VHLDRTVSNVFDPKERSPWKAESLSDGQWIPRVLWNRSFISVFTPLNIS